MAGLKALIPQGEADATATTTANTTTFWAWGACLNLDAFDTTEANAQVLQKNAGILSDISVGLTANGVAGTSTFTFRKNGADGNMQLSIPASTTGNFTLANTAITDTVASGDLTSLKFIPGATTGTIVIRTGKSIFTNTSSNETITRLGVGGFPVVTYSTASTTLFEPIAGEAQGVDVAVETKAQCKMRKPGTIRNAAIFVTINNRTTTTTFTLRKNGVDTAITIPVTSGTTGWVEDTSHSVTVAADDLINWSIVTLTGTQNIKLALFLCDFATTDGWFPVIVAGADAASQTDALTRFCPIAGFRDVNATETNLDTAVGGNFTLAELTCNVTANDIAAVSTITLRNNATSTALVASTVASTTGQIGDTTHTVTVVPTDKIDYQLVATSVAGTHSMTVNSIIVWGMEITVPQTVMIEWEES